MNPPSSDSRHRGLSTAVRLKVRAALKEAIRAFFRDRDYLEVDTPLAVLCPGTEVHLNYFATEWQDFRNDKHQLYLRSSPELHMKQLIAAGVPRILQMATCFRNNGELSAWHHPEFTMLEWYETGISFESFIALTEELLQTTMTAMQPVLAPLGRSIDLELPARLPRLTVAEAFERFAGLSLVDQDADFAKQAVAKGCFSVNESDDFETAFFKVLIDKVEPGLMNLGSVVLYDYPPSQAALATVKNGVAKRFEIYVQRVEICNGFEELLAAEANRQRIGAAMRRRQALKLSVPTEDEDFYQALEAGLPPCCGNALGFDRWLALLLGDANLDSAVPFRRALPYRNLIV